MSSVKESYQLAEPLRSLFYTTVSMGAVVIYHVTVYGLS